MRAVMKIPSLTNLDNSLTITTNLLIRNYNVTNTKICVYTAQATSGSGCRCSTSDSAAHRRWRIKASVSTFLKASANA